MELIGHENTKEQINIALKSAQDRNVALPHMLFAGAAGCGKTTLARSIARLSGSDFISVFPDSIKEKPDILKMLTALNTENYSRRGHRTGVIKPSVVFIDEIHRLTMAAQELLGIAMEEFKVPGGKSNKYYLLPYFTMVGATTDDGRLSKPFRDRMKIRFAFETYPFEEAVEIVKAHAYELNIDITSKAAMAIARRGRGVPRILVRYLERVRDYALSIEARVILSAAVEMTFSNLGIDEEGLTPVDIKILKILYDSGEAIGLESLAISLDESPKTLSQSVEPFLIQKGFMIRSGKGRKITQAGIEYIEDSDSTVEEKFKWIEVDASFERR